MVIDSILEFSPGTKVASLGGVECFSICTDSLKLDAARKRYFCPFGGVQYGVRRVYVLPEMEIAWWRAGSTWHVVTAHPEGSAFRGITWILLQKARTKAEAEAVVLVALNFPGAVDEFVTLRVARTAKPTAKELAIAFQAASQIRDRYETR